VVDKLNLRKTLFSKFIAAFVLAAFCLNTSSQSLYAQALSGSLHPHHGINQANPMTLIDSLKLPEELGIIQDRFIPEGKLNQLVIYLQSAHTNLDSETNTKRLIEYFQKEYGLDLVLLEGGEGSFDSLFFKSFPDERMKEKLLNDYLSKGELSGGEAASILSEDYETKYYGIETQSLYDENKQAFLNAVSKEKEINQILAQIESKLTEESKNLFSSEPKTFFDKQQAFSREEIDLIEYLKTLKELYESEIRNQLSSDSKVKAENLILEQGTFKSFETSYPELFKLLTAKSNESRFKGEDFEIAMTQTIQTFKEKVLPKLPKARQMELNQMIQMHQIGALSQGMLVKRIQDVSKEINFTFETPKVLKPTAKHAQTLLSIKGTKLFNELETLESELRNALPKSNQERTLLANLYHLKLLKDFSRLEIVHKDWDLIKKYKPSELFSAVIASPEGAKQSRMEIASAMPGLLLRNDNQALERLDSLFISHFHFYELALKRDQALFENMMKRLKEEKAKITVVSTGGFHSEGITQKLKAQNIPYLLISPKINQIGDRSIYLNVMEGKRSYMKYFNGSLWDALAQDYSAKLAASLKEQELTPSLKKWRDRIIQNSIAEGRITQAGSYTKYVDALVRALRKEYEKESPLTDHKMSEDELKQKLNQELNSFMSQYFNQIESVLKRKLDIFSSGLKDLWKQKEINPKSINNLIERMNSMRTSNLAEELVLAHRIILPVKNQSLMQQVKALESININPEAAKIYAEQFGNRLPKPTRAEARTSVLDRRTFLGTSTVLVEGLLLSPFPNLLRGQDKLERRQINLRNLFKEAEGGWPQEYAEFQGRRLSSDDVARIYLLPQFKIFLAKLQRGRFEEKDFQSLLELGSKAEIFRKANGYPLQFSPEIHQRFESIYDSLGAYFTQADENENQRFRLPADIRLPIYLRDALNSQWIVIRQQGKLPLFLQNPQSISDAFKEYTRVDEFALSDLFEVPPSIARYPLKKLVESMIREQQAIKQLTSSSRINLSEQAKNDLDDLLKSAKDYLRSVGIEGPMGPPIVAVLEPNLSDKHAAMVKDQIKKMHARIQDEQLRLYEIGERDLSRLLIELKRVARLGAQFINASFVILSEKENEIWNKVKRVVEWMTSQGLLIFAGAGNNEKEMGGAAATRLYGLAAIEGVISVSSKISNANGMFIPFFGNSTTADLAYDVRRLINPGTSFSTAAATGTATNIFHQHPELFMGNAKANRIRMIQELHKQGFAKPTALKALQNISSSRAEARTTTYERLHQATFRISSDSVRHIVPRQNKIKVNAGIDFVVLDGENLPAGAQDFLTTALGNNWQADFDEQQKLILFFRLPHAEPLGLILPNRRGEVVLIPLIDKFRMAQLASINEINQNFRRFIQDSFIQPSGYRKVLPIIYSAPTYVFIDPAQRNDSKFQISYFQRISTSGIPNGKDVHFRITFDHEDYERALRQDNPKFYSFGIGDRIFMRPLLTERIWSEFHPLRNRREKIQTRHDINLLDDVFSFIEPLLLHDNRNLRPRSIDAGSIVGQVYHWFIWNVSAEFTESGVKINLVDPTENKIVYNIPFSNEPIEKIYFERSRSGGFTRSVQPWREGEEDAAVALAIFALGLVKNQGQPHFFEGIPTPTEFPESARLWLSSQLDRDFAEALQSLNPENAEDEEILQRVEEAIRYISHDQLRQMDLIRFNVPDRLSGVSVRHQYKMQTLLNMFTRETPPNANVLFKLALATRDLKFLSTVLKQVVKIEESGELLNPKFLNLIRISATQGSRALLELKDKKLHPRAEARSIESNVTAQIIKKITDELKQSKNSHQAWIDSLRKSVAYLVWGSKNSAAPNWATELGINNVLDSAQLLEIGKGLQDYWKEQRWNLNDLNSEILFLANPSPADTSEKEYQEGEQRKIYLAGGNLEEQLLRDMESGLASVFHIRDIKPHILQESTLPSDNEILKDSVRRFISRLLTWTARQGANKFDDRFLWALTVMLDPIIHDMDLGLVISKSEALFYSSKTPDYGRQIWSKGGRQSIPYYLLSMLTNLERVDENGNPVFQPDGKLAMISTEEIENLLISVLTRTEKDWNDLNFRSPFHAKSFREQKGAQILNVPLRSKAFEEEAPEWQRTLPQYENSDLFQKAVFLTWPEFKQEFPNLNQLVRAQNPELFKRIIDYSQKIERAEVRNAEVRSQETKLPSVVYIEKGTQAHQELLELMTSQPPEKTLKEFIQKEWGKDPIQLPRIVLRPMVIGSEKKTSFEKLGFKTVDESQTIAEFRKIIEQNLKQEMISDVQISEESKRLQRLEIFFSSKIKFRGQEFEKITLLIPQQKQISKMSHSFQSLVAEARKENKAEKNFTSEEFERLVTYFINKVVTLEENVPVPHDLILPDRKTKLDLIGKLEIASVAQPDWEFSILSEEELKDLGQKMAEEQKITTQSLRKEAKPAPAKKIVAESLLQMPFETEEERTIVKEWAELTALPIQFYERKNENGAPYVLELKNERIERLEIAQNIRFAELVKLTRDLMANIDAPQKFLIEENGNDIKKIEMAFYLSLIERALKKMEDFKASKTIPLSKVLDDLSKQPEFQASPLSEQLARISDILNSYNTKGEVSQITDFQRIVDQGIISTGTGPAIIVGYFLQKLGYKVYWVSLFRLSEQKKAAPYIGLLLEKNGRSSSWGLSVEIPQKPSKKNRMLANTNTKNYLSMLGGTFEDIKPALQELKLGNTVKASTNDALNTKSQHPLILQPHAFVSHYLQGVYVALWYDLSKKYYDENRYAKSIVAVKKALVMEPNHAESHFQLGLSSYKLAAQIVSSIPPDQEVFSSHEKYFDQAINAFEKAIKINPKARVDHFWSNLGSAYFQKAQDQENERDTNRWLMKSARAFSRALNINPRNALAEAGLEEIAKILRGEVRTIPEEELEHILSGTIELALTWDSKPVDIFYNKEQIRKHLLDTPKNHARLSSIARAITDQVKMNTKRTRYYVVSLQGNSIHIRDVVRPRQARGEVRSELLPEDINLAKEYGFMLDYKIGLKDIWEKLKEKYGIKFLREPAKFQKELKNKYPKLMAIKQWIRTQIKTLKGLSKRGFNWEVSTELPQKLYPDQGVLDYFRFGADFLFVVQNQKISLRIKDINTHKDLKPRELEQLFKQRFQEGGQERVKGVIRQLQTGMPIDSIIDRQPSKAFSSRAETRVRVDFLILSSAGFASIAAAITGIIIERMPYGPLRLIQLLYKFIFYAVAMRMNPKKYAAQGFSEAAPQIRKLIVNTVERLKDKTFLIDTYIEVLHNSNPDVSSEAVAALVKLNKQKDLDRIKTVEALIDHLQSENYFVRMKIVEAIVELADEKMSALEKLERLLPATKEIKIEGRTFYISQEFFTRVAAAQTIGKLVLKQDQMKVAAVDILNKTFEKNTAEILDTLKRNDKLFDLASNPSSNLYVAEEVAKSLIQLAPSRKSEVESRLAELKKKIYSSKPLEIGSVPISPGDKRVFFRQLPGKLENGDLDNFVDQDGILNIFLPPQTNQTKRSSAGTGVQEAVGALHKGDWNLAIRASSGRVPFNLEISVIPNRVDQENGKNKKVEETKIILPISPTPTWTTVHVSIPDGRPIYFATSFEGKRDSPAVLQLADFQLNETSEPSRAELLTNARAEVRTETESIEQRILDLENGPPINGFERFQAIRTLWAPENANKFGRLKYLIAEKYKNVIGIRNLIPRLISPLAQNQEAQFNEAAGELFIAEALEKLFSPYYQVEVLGLGLNIGYREFDIFLKITRREGINPPLNLKLEEGLYLVEAKEDKSQNLQNVINQTLKSQVPRQINNAELLKEAGVPVKGIIVAVGGKNGVAVDKKNGVSNTLKEENLSNLKPPDLKLPVYSIIVNNFDVETEKAPQDTLVPLPTDSDIQAWTNQRTNILALFENIFNPHFQAWYGLKQTKRLGREQHKITKQAGHALRILLKREERRIELTKKQMTLRRKERLERLKDLKEGQRRETESYGWQISFREAYQELRRAVPGIDVQEPAEEVLSAILDRYFTEQKNIPLENLRRQLQEQYREMQVNLSIRERIIKTIYSLSQSWFFDSPLQKFFIKWFLGKLPLTVVRDPRNAWNWLKSQYPTPISIQQSQRQSQPQRQSESQTQPQRRERIQRTQRVDTIEQQIEGPHGWLESFKNHKSEFNAGVPEEQFENEVRRVLTAYFQQFVDQANGQGIPVRLNVPEREIRKNINSPDMGWQQTWDWLQSQAPIRSEARVNIDDFLASAEEIIIQEENAFALQQKEELNLREREDILDRIDNAVLKPLNDFTSRMNPSQKILANEIRDRAERFKAKVAVVRPEVSVTKHEDLLIVRIPNEDIIYATNVDELQKGLRKLKPPHYVTTNVTHNPNDSAHDLIWIENPVTREGKTIKFGSTAEEIKTVISDALARSEMRTEDTASAEQRKEWKNRMLRYLDAGQNNELINYINTVHRPYFIGFLRAKRVREDANGIVDDFIGFFFEKFLEKTKSKLESVELKGEPEPLLDTVIIRRWIDFLRQRGSQNNLFKQLADAEEKEMIDLATEKDTVTEIIEREDIKAYNKKIGSLYIRIMDFISKGLSDRERDIFIARHINHEGYEEVARRFGINVNAARIIDFRVRGKIRGVFQADFDQVSSLLRRAEARTNENSKAHKHNLFRRKLPLTAVALLALGIGSDMPYPTVEPKVNPKEELLRTQSSIEFNDVLEQALNKIPNPIRTQINKIPSPVKVDPSKNILSAMERQDVLIRELVKRYLLDRFGIEEDKILAIKRPTRWFSAPGKPIPPSADERVIVYLGLHSSIVIDIKKKSGGINIKNLQLMPDVIKNQFKEEGKLKKIIDELLKLLREEKNSDILISPIYTLGNIGPQAKEAIPILKKIFEETKTKKILEHEDKELIKTIEETLEKIEGQTKVSPRAEVRTQEIKLPNVIYIEELISSQDSKTALKLSEAERKNPTFAANLGGRAEMRNFELIPAPLDLKKYLDQDEKIEQIVLVSDNSGTVVENKNAQMNNTTVNRLRQFLGGKGNFVILNTGDPEKDVFGISQTPLIETLDADSSSRYFATTDGGSKGFSIRNARQNKLFKSGPWPVKLRIQMAKELINGFYEQLLKRQGVLENLLSVISNEQIQHARQEALSRLNWIETAGQWGKKSKGAPYYEFSLLEDGPIKDKIGYAYLYDVSSKVTLKLEGKEVGSALDFTRAIENYFRQYALSHKEKINVASGKSWVDLTRTTKAVSAERIFRQYVSPKLNHAKKTLVIIIGDAGNDLPTLNLEFSGLPNLVVLPIFLSHDSVYANEMHSDVFVAEKEHTAGASQVLDFLNMISGKTVGQIQPLNAMKYTTHSEVRNDDEMVRQWIQNNNQGEMVVRSDDNKEFKFTYKTIVEKDSGLGEQNVLEVYDAGQKVGFVHFDISDQMVNGKEVKVARIKINFNFEILSGKGIWVKSNYRRRGLAAALLGLAIRIAKAKKALILRAEEVEEPDFFEHAQFVDKGNRNYELQLDRSDLIIPPLEIKKSRAEVRSGAIQSIPNAERVRELLQNRTQLPDPLTVTSFSEADIRAGAILSGFKEPQMSKTLEELDQILPYLLEIVKVLLKDLTRYEKILVAGRDANVFYFALRVLLAGGPYQDKVMLYPGSMDFWNHFNQYPVEEKRKFFSQFGISKEAIEDGKQFLVLDSGFYGSIVDSTRKAIQEVYGYLVPDLDRYPSARNLSVVRAFPGKMVSDSTTFAEMLLRIDINKNQLQNIFPKTIGIQGIHSYETANSLLATAIQLLPVHHGPYDHLEEGSDGRLYFVPAGNDVVEENVDKFSYHNDSRVNPYAALLIQHRIVSYFLSQRKNLPITRAEVRTKNLINLMLDRRNFSRLSLAGLLGLVGIPSAVLLSYKSIHMQKKPEGLILPPVSSQMKMFLNDPEVLSTFHAPVKSFKMVSRLADLQIAWRNEGIGQLTRKIIEQYEEDTKKIVSEEVKQKLKTFQSMIANPKTDPFKLLELYTQLEIAIGESYGARFWLNKGYNLSFHGLRHIEFQWLVHEMQNGPIRSLLSLKLQQALDVAEAYLLGRIPWDDKVVQAFLNIKVELENKKDLIDRIRTTYENIVSQDKKRFLDLFYQRFTKEQILATSRWFSEHHVRIAFPKNHPWYDLYLISFRAALEPLPPARYEGVILELSKEAVSGVSYDFRTDVIYFSFEHMFQGLDTPLSNFLVTKDFWTPIWVIINHELSHRWDFQQLPVSIRKSFYNVSWSTEKVWAFNKRRQLEDIRANDPFAPNADQLRDFVLNFQAGKSGYAEEDIAVTVEALLEPKRVAFEVARAIQNLQEGRPHLANKIAFAYKFWERIPDPNGLWIVRLDQAEPGQLYGTYAYRDLSGYVYKITLLPNGKATKPVLIDSSIDPNKFLHQEKKSRAEVRSGDKKVQDAVEHFLLKNFGVQSLSTETLQQIINQPDQLASILISALKVRKGAQPKFTKRAPQLIPDLKNEIANAKIQVSTPPPAPVQPLSITTNFKPSIELFGNSYVRDLNPKEVGVLAPKTADLKYNRFIRDEHLQQIAKQLEQVGLSSVLKNVGYTRTQIPAGTRPYIARILQRTNQQETLQKIRGEILIPDYPKGRESIPIEINSVYPTEVIKLVAEGGPLEAEFKRLSIDGQEGIRRSTEAYPNQVLPKRNEATLLGLMKAAILHEIGEMIFYVIEENASDEQKNEDIHNAAKHLISEWSVSGRRIFPTPIFIKNLVKAMGDSNDRLIVNNFADSFVMYVDRNSIYKNFGETHNEGSREYFDKVKDFLLMLEKEKGNMFSIPTRAEVRGISEAKIIAFHDELGIEREIFLELVVKHPPLAGLSPARVRDEFERELSISKSDLAQAIVKFPQLAGYSPARVRDEFERELSISKSDLAQAIVKFPQLAGYSPARVRDEFERELSISKSDLAQAIVKHPPLAGLSPARVRDEFERELSISKSDLAQAIVKFPQLAGYSVSINLKPKLIILRNLGMNHNEELPALIKISTFSVNILNLMVEISRQERLELTNINQIINLYRNLNKKVKELKGQTAGILIRSNSSELMMTVKPVLKTLMLNTLIPRAEARKVELKTVPQEVALPSVEILAKEFLNGFPTENEVERFAEAYAAKSDLEKNELFNKLKDEVFKQLEKIRGEITPKLKEQILNQLLNKKQSVMVEEVKEIVQENLKQTLSFSNAVPLHSEITPFQEIATLINNYQKRSASEVVELTDKSVDRARSELRKLSSIEKPWVIVMEINSPEAFEQAAKVVSKVASLTYAFPFKNQNELAKARAELRINSSSDFRVTEYNNQLWLFHEGSIPNIYAPADIIVTAHPLVKNDVPVLGADHYKDDRSEIRSDAYGLFAVAAPILLMNEDIQQGSIRRFTHEELTDLTSFVHVLALGAQGREVRARAA